MSLMAVPALAMSTALIVLLCIGDPKRRRARRIKGGEQSSAKRWLLSVAICVPGLGLALIGDSAAFLIWLGGYCVAGWLVAVGFGAARRGDA